MLLELLALTNFSLGVYDTYLTSRRMKAFGLNFELNTLIRFIATHLGPDGAAVLGVLVPVVGWTYIFTYFNLPVALALLVGYNIKRFELQLSSAAFENSAKEIQRQINEFQARK